MSTRGKPASWFSAEYGIEAEANLGDLRLRRQAAAREAVDPQHGAGPGHLLQLLGHLVLVVGQGVDLVLRQRRREVVADVLVGLVAGDLDLLDVAGDRQLDVAPLLPAAADVDVGDLRRLEADRLDLDDVLAGREAARWLASPCSLAVVVFASVPDAALAAMTETAAPTMAAPVWSRTTTLMLPAFGSGALRPAAGLSGRRRLARGLRLGVLRDGGPAVVVEKAATASSRANQERVFMISCSSCA